MLYIRQDKFFGKMLYAATTVPALGIVLLVGLTISALYVPQTIQAYREKIACQHFSNQEEAQVRYDSDKVSYRALDRDKDGQACEHLKP